MTTPLAARPLAAQPPELASLLRPFGGLSARDAATLARGDVVVRTIAAADRDEIALLGVVDVDVPRSLYAAHADDPRLLAASRAPLAMGGFRTPASAADAAALSLDDDDARALAACRPLHCSVKLPASVMSALHGTADPSAALRAWLASFVDDYRARGAAAMPVYDDTRRDERSADGFAELLAEDDTLLREAPGLGRLLAGSPRDELPGARSTIYWLSERPPGLTTLVSVVQRTVYAPAGGATIVVDKQLYTSHYLDALLDVHVALDAPAATPRMHLVVVRRARFDHLPSPGIFSMRRRIVAKLRDELHATLLRTKRALETWRD